MQLGTEKRRRVFVSPRENTILIIVASSRSIIRKSGEIDSRFSTNIDRLRARVGIEISGGVSRISRIDLDAELSEGFGVRDGNHVESGLGRVISEGGIVVVRIILIGSEGERSQTAGNIDDASGLGLLQKIEEGSGRANDTKDVDIVGFLDLRDLFLKNGSPSRSDNTSIVDKNIERRNLLGKRLGSSSDTLIGSNVNNEQMDVRMAGSTKLIDSLLSTGLIARSNKDLVSTTSKLASDLLADTLVGTSNQNGFLGLGETKKKGVSEEWRVERVERVERMPKKKKKMEQYPCSEPENGPEKNWRSLSM